jgi:iron(III) transport system substrate-binding protein
MTLKRLVLVLLLPVLLTILFFTSNRSKGKTVWIYASMYKEVVADFEKSLKEAFPEIQIRWYQSGSENVAARVNAELSTGVSQADLILTSDPFWFVELKKSNHLFPYISPESLQLDSKYHDPEGAFSINRLPVGVIVYNKSSISMKQAPQSWDDLKSSFWRGKISMPSPLESGTALTFVSQLVRIKGWSYFEALKKNELLSAGGNSAVMQRIETGEKPVGIVLLENALQTKKRGANIEIVYPSEGVIPVPSPIAILSKSRNIESAKKIYDFFFQDTAQKIYLGANVYSPTLKSLAPESAKPFSEIDKTVFDWNAKILNELQENKETIKNKFTEMILQ